MASTTDIVRIVLLAFVGGLAVPILVQLFLTLRTLQRVSLSVERRIDETSREVTHVLAGLRREPSGPDALSLIASAAVPAVLAAVRAFRAPPATSSHPNGTAHHQPQEEKTP
jgi:hypothetical protein